MISEEQIFPKWAELKKQLKLLSKQIRNFEIKEIENKIYIDYEDLDIRLEKNEYYDYWYIYIYEPPDPEQISPSWLDAQIHLGRTLLKHYDGYIGRLYEYNVYGEALNPEYALNYKILNEPREAISFIKKVIEYYRKGKLFGFLINTYMHE